MPSCHFRPAQHFTGNEPAAHAQGEQVGPRVEEYLSEGY